MSFGLENAAVILEVVQGHTNLELE